MTKDEALALLDQFIVDIEMLNLEDSDLWRWRELREIVAFIEIEYWEIAEDQVKKIVQ